MDVTALLDIVASTSGSALKSVQLDDIFKFIRYVDLVKPHIYARVLDITTPPTQLPPNILAFLAAVLKKPAPIIEAWWAALRHWAWRSRDVPLATDDEIYDFVIHGLPRKIAYRSTFPPVRTCTVAGCAGRRDTHNVRTLVDHASHEATLFTLRHGALPIFTTSLYCKHCNVRYYPDHCVHKASSTRTYYDTFPAIIQVAKHFFVEAQLLELFANGMVFGWLSSSNCARIYNEALAVRNSVLRNNKLAFGAAHHAYMLRLPCWEYSLDMRPEDVLNGFFLYSLLLHHAEHSTTLVLPHDMGSQAYRLEAALAVRNKAMEGIGQEAYPHACDLCYAIVNRNGVPCKAQAAVDDGTTLGHPSCGIPNCKVELANNHHRFCPDHAEHAKYCAVKGCNEPHAPRRRMCDIPEHRALEDAHESRGNSMFYLRKRWKSVSRSGCAPADSVEAGPGSDIHEDDEAEVEAELHAQSGVTDDSCAGVKKSDDGNTKLRAMFGRRRTHNEQIISRPCGVILSRASMYNAEQLTSVIEHAKSTFPTPESTPEYLFYDNNCHLREWLHKRDDKHFKHTAFPVDVFHFRTKHKETHQACQQFCNPAAFPELIVDGKWRFNSSICEQTNVWLGGYNAILREMEVTRYNFFLDEMIKRRNRFTIAQLEKQKKAPWMIPINVLFPL